MFAYSIRWGNLADGILECQLRHREATILYDSQKISYDQILETVLQASYHISMFYVWEEC